MITYDYIITGLGCAGMSLLHYLLESPLKSKKILVIDSCSKNTNDRTWCYWAEKPLEIHPKSTPLIFWNEINIINEGKAVRKKLGKLTEVFLLGKFLTVFLHYRSKKIHSML
jgi:lycopene beta-cyclase